MLISVGKLLNIFKRMNEAIHPLFEVVSVEVYKLMEVVDTNQLPKMNMMIMPNFLVRLRLRCLNSLIGRAKVKTS